MNKIATSDKEPSGVLASTLHMFASDLDLSRFQPPKKFSITVTINVCFVTLLFVAIAAILWVQWSTGSRNIDEFMANRAETVIEHLDDRLHDFLVPARIYASRMARRAAREGWDLGDPGTIRNLLVTSVAAASQIKSASVLLPDGTEKRAVTDADTGFSYYDTYRHDTPSFRALMDMLKASDEPVWTAPVYRTEDEEVVTDVWHPIRRDGRFVGAWGASISIASLSETVARFGDDYGGTAFILHGRKRVLAHPLLMSEHPDHGLDSSVVTIDRLGDYHLGNIWSGAESDLLEVEIETGSIHQVRFASAGVEYLAFYRWIDRYDRIPWILGAMFEAKPLDLQHDRLMTATFIGLGALAIAVLLALVMGRAIAKPIRRTADAVSQIGDLEFDDLDPLPRSVFREIDELATSYNRMAGALKLFQTYVPRKLVRRLVDGSGNAVVSREKQVAVMFTDIEGFTSISEGKTPTEVADFVNHHFKVLGECVEAFGGTIDKYIGDSMMVFWGAPEDVADVASRACHAARTIAEALEWDNLDRRLHGDPPVHIRIGIHVGPAVVGNIGAPERVDYTIVGDTVNTCQRIETLARDLPSRGATTILISEDVARDLPSSMPYVEVGKFAIKGKTEELTLYRLLT